jgi:hypothetical protein
LKEEGEGPRGPRLNLNTRTSIMSLTEGRHAAAFVLSEAQGNRSRGNLRIAASMAVLVGMVLGAVGANAGAVTVADPVFTGTGNGALTKANPAYGAGVQAGNYEVIFYEGAGSDDGYFLVKRPDGTIDGRAIVGVAYDGQVKFSIADGGTDFAAAAKFVLAVSIAAAADEGQFKALDLSAADGAAAASAIALYPATTGVGETADIAGIVRDSEVNGKELTWPDGITDDQKTAAIAQLAERGIIVR